MELDLTDATITQQQNKAAAESYLQWIHSDRPELLEQVSQDDMQRCSPEKYHPGQYPQMAV